MLLEKDILHSFVRNSDDAAIVATMKVILVDGKSCTRSATETAINTADNLLNSWSKAGKAAISVGGGHGVHMASTAY